MELDNIPEDVWAAFKKENQITVAEAVIQIRKWIWDKNFPAAEDWIKEIEKYVPELKDLVALKSELISANAEKLQKNADSMKAETQNVQIFSQDERMLSSLSYIWFLAIIPLVIKHDSLLCKHHWKQWLIFSIFFFFLFKFVGIIPWGLWSFMSWLLDFAQLIIAIYGWLKAYKWELWEAPIAKDFTNKINF